MNLRCKILIVLILTVAAGTLGAVNDSYRVVVLEQTVSSDGSRSLAGPNIQPLFRDGSHFLFSIPGNITEYMHREPLSTPLVTGSESIGDWKHMYHVTPDHGRQYTVTYIESNTVIYLKFYASEPDYPPPGYARSEWLLAVSPGTEWAIVSSVAEQLGVLDLINQANLASQFQSALRSANEP